MGIFSHLMSMQKDKANTSFITKLGMGAISGGIGSFVGAFCMHELTQAPAVSQPAMCHDDAHPEPSVNNLLFFR